jgi:hypothetical protein
VKRGMVDWVGGERDGGKRGRKDVGLCGVRVGVEGFDWGVFG